MPVSLVLLRRLLWRAFAVSAILVAVALSVARLLLANAPDYRVDVESWATQRAGRPVSIGVLEARWLGLRPQLILKDLRLFDPQGGVEVLRLSEARVSVEPLPLITAGRIVPFDVTLVGARLALTRLADGSFEVAGMPGGSGAGGAQRLLLVLCAQRLLTGLSVSQHSLAKSQGPPRFLV